MNAKSLLLLSLAAVPSAAISSQAYGQVASPKVLVPTLSPAKSLQIHEIHVGKTSVYHLKATNQSQADIFEAIALAGDFRVVVDPILKNHLVPSLSVAALDLGELFDNIVVAGNFEVLRSSSGTHFVTEKHSTLLPIEPAAAPAPATQSTPHLPQFNINQTRSFNKKIEPQPHWEKFIFNGEEIYMIPLPQMSPKISTKNTTK